MEFPLNRTRALALPLLLLVAASTGLAASCAEPTPTLPAPIPTLITNPVDQEVEVGEQVAVSAQSIWGDRARVTWRAERGRLQRTEGPSVIYTAPETAGKDTLDVTMVAEDGRQETRTLAFTVVAEPTVPPTISAGVAMAVGTVPSASDCNSPRIGIAGGDSTGTVTIASPSACTHVGESLDVTGNYSANVDEALWVLVWARKARLYFPQSRFGGPGPADKSDGDWTSMAILGDSGEWFDLVVVAADETASAFFLKWLEDGLKNNTWPGLTIDDLPAGITEKAVVSVYRQ